MSFDGAFCNFFTHTIRSIGAEKKSPMEISTGNSVPHDIVLKKTSARQMKEIGKEMNNAWRRMIRTRAP